MLNLMFQTLLNSIDSRQAKVGVIGLGYVGLPLIQAFVSAGYHTLGFDVDLSKVDQLLSKDIYFTFCNFISINRAWHTI